MSCIPTSIMASRFSGVLTVRFPVLGSWNPFVTPIVGENTGNCRQWMTAGWLPIGIPKENHMPGKLMRLTLTVPCPNDWTAETQADTQAEDRP